MVITVYEGNDNSYVLLRSKDERFWKMWGRTCRVTSQCFYKDLATITAWCNNKFDEECLFEVG